MRTLQRYVYQALGAVFLVSSITTLLNIAAAWRAGYMTLWSPTGYAVLDALVAYAFFRHYTWLLPLMALNSIGLCIVLFENATALHAALLLASVGVSVFLYATRRDQKHEAMIAGGASLILWLALFSYAISG